MAIFFLFTKEAAWHRIRIGTLSRNHFYLGEMMSLMTVFSFLFESLSTRVTKE